MEVKPPHTYDLHEPSQPTPTWVLVLIVGISAIGLGLLFLASPAGTAKLVTKLLGLFFLIGGMTSMFSIAINSEHWGWKLLAGIAGVIGGMVVIEHPLWSSVMGGTVLVMTLAVIGILMGGSQVILAFRGGGWGTGILGVIYFVFGLILLFSPVIGALALPFVLAGFGIIGGFIAIYIAFRLRRIDKDKSEEAV